MGQISINHHRIPKIKFRALGTHYPTGKYLQSWNDNLDEWTKWFELHIEGLEITWFCVYPWEEEYSGKCTNSQCYCDEVADCMVFKSEEVELE